jgi:hypothetical protein
VDLDVIGRLEVHSRRTFRAPGARPAWLRTQAGLTIPVNAETGDVGDHAILPLLIPDEGSIRCNRSSTRWSLPSAGTLPRNVHVGVAGFPGVNCCSLRALLVLTDQPAEDPAALDLRCGKVPGMIGAAVEWPEVAGPVRAVLIVVRGVLALDCAQVPPPRTEHPAGQLRAHRENPAPAPAGGCGLRGGIVTTSIPALAGHRGGRAGELPGPVPDQDPGLPGLITEVHPQVPRLLHRPCAAAICHAENVRVAAAGFQDEQHLDPLEGDGAAGRGTSRMPAWTPPASPGTAARSHHDAVVRAVPADVSAPAGSSRR